MDIPYQILFLEASDDILIQRFKETRRNHPLSPQGTISEGIRLERRKLSELRKIPDTPANEIHIPAQQDPALSRGAILEYKKDWE